MIASEFIYDEIVSGLTLSSPVYIGAGPNLNTSYIYFMDVNNVANPAYLRDQYTIKFYGKFERTRYDEGLTDFYTIKNNILGHPNITDTNGNIWCRFLMVQGPQFLGTDDQGRSIFTMEYEMTVDGSNGLYRESIQ